MLLEEGRGHLVNVVQTPKTPKSSIRNIDIPALFRNELKQYKLKQRLDKPIQIGHICTMITPLSSVSPIGKYLAKTNVLQ